jgi:hypothetical protein
VNVISLLATSIYPLIGGAGRGETALLRAQLKKLNGGAVVAGRQVQFAIGSWTGTATSGPDGWAACAYPVAADAVGPLSVAISFGGDSTYAASSATGSLPITALARSSLYVLPVSGKAGDTVTLKASLYRTNSNGTQGIGGKSVRITVGSFTATDTTTIPKGWANIPFTIPADATGTLTITATFDGDTEYTSCTRTGVLTVLP